MPAAPRTEKLDLRLSSEAKQRISAAAKAQGRSVSDFVLSSALDCADEALADRRVWALDAAQWKKFQDALDAPPRGLPELRRLLNTPGPFDPPQR
jgi:uncharacterized protein (DUF1778 family)